MACKEFGITSTTEAIPITPELMVLLEQGKQAMDTLRAVVAASLAEEHRLLDERVASRHAVERAEIIAGILAAVLALLVLPVAVDLPERGLLAQLTTVGRYVLYTPLAVLTVTAVAWGPTIISPLLEQRWVLRMGEASYSFYMLQWNALLIATVIAGGTPGWFLPVLPGWWLSVAAILVLAFVSLASMRWIEAPARRFLRGAPVTRAALS